MGDRPMIRLFRCCPIRAAFDSILRDVMIPDLQARPGLLDVRVGRTGSGELGERLVASVWRSEAAMFDTLGPDVEDSGFHPEFLTETTNRSIEILPLEIMFQASPDDTPALMRVARGTVRSGELEPYVEAARAGAAEDVARGTGPMAFQAVRTHRRIRVPSRRCNVPGRSERAVVSATPRSFPGVGPYEPRRPTRRPLNMTAQGDPRWPRPDLTR